MPYRRLPTTDAARIRALHNAAAIAEKVDMHQLAFPYRYIHPLRNNISRMEGAKHQQTTSWQHLKTTSEANHHKLQKTKLFLSHFIQVLNLAIQREEVPKEARDYYGLSPESNRVPELNTDDAVFEWGKKIIDGESKRISSGGLPMMNPTIAKVKVWYDQFKDGYYNHQTAQRSYHRANQKMAELRKEIDHLISQVWNEIENNFIELPDEQKREKAAEYGVIYVYRKSELIE